MRKDDLPTVCAIAVLAMCVTTAAHEAVGHGAACLAAGGRITQLTSVYFQCAAHSPWVSPAGPMGNLAAAIIAWVALNTLPAKAVRGRLFALLVMALSFFWAAGYLIYSMATGGGDYMVAGEDLLGEPSTLWRVAGAVLGVGLYILSARMTARAAAGLSAAPARLLSLAWIAATVTAVAAAALYAPGRYGAMGQAALEIGLAGAPLLLIGRRQPPNEQAPPVDRSLTWIAIAAVVFVAFAATLGRGLS